jgi:hypothetical protein
VPGYARTPCPDGQRSDTATVRDVLRVDAAPQGETVRLFEPAPAQMPGQIIRSARTAMASRDVALVPPPMHRRSSRAGSVRGPNRTLPQRRSTSALPMTQGVPMFDKPLYMPEAKTFADVLEYHGEWNHSWPRHPETNATIRTTV